MATERRTIGIIGSGPAALITAHTLIKDGFDNVQLITRDGSVGGIWAKERVYPGLSLNNVHGELRFSPLEMLAPPNAGKTGGRLTGEVMSDYMESFYNKFLQNRILSKTEVLKIKRGESNGGWIVKVEDLTTGTTSDLHFSKIVLCTGGHSNPNVPSCLSPHAAEAARFRGIVLHSSQFNQELPNILAAVKPVRPGSDAETGRVVIIGCGKSAQDMAAYLANQGRKVAVVYEHLEPYLATPRPLPAILRKSRAFSTLSPYSALRSRLERLFHTTWLGSKFIRYMFKTIGEDGFHAYNIPKGSPLRNVESFFWGTRINDEGVARPNSFFALANSGQIEMYTPARAAWYDGGADGRSILLNDGRKVAADIVILATGYRSSWETLFDDETAQELGIFRHTLPQTALANDEWASYHTLHNPPSRPSHDSKPVSIVSSSIYRGIVPAKNIHRKDFAINGAILSGNNGYLFEVIAHWISSYFLCDQLKLPATPELALEEAERHSAWCQKRFPNMLGTLNESTSAALHLWSWPQAADELLEDMHLKSGRSGGWWFNWILKVIDLKEIENLTEERRALRAAGRL